MKRILSAVLVTLCASGFTTVQAEAKKKINVEVQFGDSYEAALGNDVSTKARQLAEQELVLSLADIVRYFEFVPSTEAANHTLSFKIGYPTQDHTAELLSVHNAYVFLTLKNAKSAREEKLHWLFRDAASNLSGADTPQSIAESLRLGVLQDQSDRIIKGLLDKVSFTESASFKSEGTRGWFINHSRLALCMHANSRLKIHSTIPGEDFEEEYDAEVKKHKRDDKTTFTKATDDVSGLSATSRVIAVHVLSYERECEQSDTIIESNPITVSFDSGGGL